MTQEEMKCTAKDFVERFGQLQRKRNMEKCICPRCGKNTMSSTLGLNALSRRAYVYICSECGTNEAMCDYLEIDDNLEDWSIVVSLRA